MDSTTLFDVQILKSANAKIILKEVAKLLEERGYQPINQIVGYLMLSLIHIQMCIRDSSSTSCPDLYYDSSTREIMWATYDYNQWFENSHSTYDPEMQDFLCGDDSQVSYYCSNSGCEYPNKMCIRDRSDLAAQGTDIYKMLDGIQKCSIEAQNNIKSTLNKVYQQQKKDKKQKGDRL